MNDLTLPISERDHVRGPIDAPVTMVQFGDYECVDCRLAHWVIQELRERFGREFRFVYRHFPLTSVHPRAQHAAEAAEAAGSQGQFWKMHDMLFENQGSLDDDDLAQYAAILQLDARRVSRELLKGTHAIRVREDYIDGLRSHVERTPAFFIDGVRHCGGYDYQSLFEAIDRARPGGAVVRPLLRLVYSKP
jgi:protein-disulfide isomerase